MPLDVTAAAPSLDTVPPKVAVVSVFVITVGEDTVGNVVNEPSVEYDRLPSLPLSA